jgi:uncharacterized protein (TIGR02217 family)
VDFHDVSLPQYIEIFAVGSSEFTTSCAVSMSGREARSSDNQIARRRYILKNCRLSQAQFDAFNSFFMARAGKRFSFRLKDYFDFTVDKQVIAIGDSVETKFQLHKLYPDNFAPYVRNITKPKINSLRLWVNREGIFPQGINFNTGIVQLASALEAGVQLVASFEFDVPVRFVHDNFSYSFNTDGTISLDNAEMIEVLE